MAQAAGAELTVRPSGQQTMEVGLPIVVAVALIAGLAGWALLAILEKANPRGTKIWTWIATVTTVLSLALPMTVEAAGATKVWLMTMHVAVAAVLIPLMQRGASRV
jgi:hypothetical protein